MLTAEKIKEALAQVKDPELNRNLVELDMVRSIEVEGRKVKVSLALTFAGCPLKDQIVAEARKAILSLAEVEEVEIETTEMTDEERRRIGLGGQKQGLAEPFNRVHHCLAIMSGKGGVGKSLVSSLLALAFRENGYRVGILDADITGPSIPKIFGLKDSPSSGPLGIFPVESKKGIKVMSINLLLPDEDMPVIWRGPLISSAIRQFWGDVFWGELDWLIVDLPPGTSDASLTVMQALPISGVVLVSTPQDLAEMVVRKAAWMARRMKVPILGLIENMSYFVCPESGRAYEIFGPTRGEEMAARLGVAFLGRLPIDPRIASLCDAGEIENLSLSNFLPIARRLIELINKNLLLK